MTIPNVPTDNLYKFLAIFGLVVGLAGFYFPEIKKYEIKEEIYQFDSDKEKAAIELQLFERERERVKGAIKEFYSKANIHDTIILNDSLRVWTKIIGGPKELVDASKSVENIINVLETKRLDLQSKQSEVLAKTKIMDLKREQVQRLDEIAYQVLPVSIMVMVAGFLLWYFKSQRIQDLILKEQYKSMVAKENRCQSCGMSLCNDKEYENLSDELKQKTKFCSTCFFDGSFTEPDITHKAMKIKIKKRLIESGMPKWAANVWFFLFSERHLNRLERWDRTFRWK